MTGGDYDGVQCDFCHRMVDPFFDPTYTGTREGNNWQIYWDEAVNTGPGSGTLAQTMADTTRAADQAVVQPLNFLNGQPYFGPTNRPIPRPTAKTARPVLRQPAAYHRASFRRCARYVPRLVQPLHKSKYFCAPVMTSPTRCLRTWPWAHRPATAHLLPTEDAVRLAPTCPVERTFSEFMLSDYGQPGGAPGIGPVRLRRLRDLPPV